MSNEIKAYRIFVTRYSIIRNRDVVEVRLVKTKDIYHEIGKIYCNTFEQIKDIRYEQIEPKIMGKSIKKIYIGEINKE